MTLGILPILLHPPSTEADRVKAIKDRVGPERTLPSFMTDSADGVEKLLNEECRRRHVTEDDQMETDWSKTSATK